MRVLLRLFVLATVAVAWAAASGDVPRAARAALAARPVATADEPLVRAEAAAAPAEDRPANADVEEPAPGGPAADIGILPGDPPADGVPVEVIVVDGENGRVLGRETTTAARGPEGVVTFRVPARDGYVAEHADPREVKAYVSRLADRVRVVEPLRREADIRVQVFCATGRPVAGAEVAAVYRGGGAPGIVALSEAPDPDDEPELPEEEIVECDLGLYMPLARAGPTGNDGWTRVRGIPHLLDERYWIVARRGEVEAFTQLLLGAFGERHTAEVRLPVASRQGAATNTFISICGGGCGSGRRGRVARRYVPATLELVVMRRDGRMGVGLEVRVGGTAGVTGAGGHARFEGLPPGTYTVEVRDPDFVWSTAQVDLRDGERRALAFHEPSGWTARAVLLGSVGRPVPFARVRVSSDAPVGYVRVDEGVQDLVFWTDAGGEVRFPSMHHAPATLIFHYGSRRASVAIDETEPSAIVRLPPP